MIAHLPPGIVCPKTAPWNLQSLDALNATWAKSARIVLRENLSARQPRRGTEVRLGWSGDFMHGLFLCQDPMPSATKTGRDDALWEEDVVEVFLDPFGDALGYFEIEINPLNTVTDLFIRRTRGGLRRELRWNCEGLQTSCGILSYGWVAAFRIPFVSLGDCHPARSPVWRVNFARIDHPQDEQCELSAWSPTMSGTFHITHRFGVMQFG